MLGGTSRTGITVLTIGGAGITVGIPGMGIIPIMEIRFIGRLSAITVAGAFSVRRTILVVRGAIMAIGTGLFGMLRTMTVAIMVDDLLIDEAWFPAPSTAKG